MTMFMRSTIVALSSMLVIGPANSAGEMDIVDTAVPAGNFGSLAVALEAAGLIETLKGDGPFTVFAPTNQAFEKLPKGALYGPDGLLKPQNRAALDQLLTYHVVAGDFQAKDLKNEQVLTTVNGSYTLTVRINDGSQGPHFVAYSLCLLNQEMQNLPLISVTLHNKWFHVPSD